MKAPVSGLIPAPLAQLPWRVLFLVIAIGVSGWVVLFSAAGGSLTPWALRQATLFCAFLGLAIVLSRVTPRTLSRIALPGYVIVLVLLILVETLGAVRGGSQRWLDLGFIRLQPSEFMKPMIILAMAKFYDGLPQVEVRRFGPLVPAGILVGVPFLLVYLQPDLGTGLMILGGGVTVMFLAGTPLRIFIGAAMALGIAGPLAYNLLLHEYQRNRIAIFLNPEADPLGTGYHISQSKIAIGSGGLTGKGFLQGSQIHLDYLPEGHTDFAFATMVEEWGLIGGLAVIVAFMLLIRWGINVGLRANTRFERLTAGGLATAIFFYFAINLMMVMGLAPVVGIPLPFISYGSSAQMTVMICIGMLMSIDRQTRHAPGGGW
ncbi:rod shape-determining protein RodA [Sphingomonas sp.]|uniref:rod shape-determining protein RodA n=1 Tax=Sphingomonas sp. TaxID=28214 RepID=UPI002DD63F21|nr:rod shape-determining protein RodA [Sphingomonas sp.]